VTFSLVKYYRYLDGDMRRLDNHHHSDCGNVVVVIVSLWNDIYYEPLLLLRLPPEYIYVCIYGKCTAARYLIRWQCDSSISQNDLLVSCGHQTSRILVLPRMSLFETLLLFDLWVVDTVGE
jgi:hypothetical protein